MGLRRTLALLCLLALSACGGGAELSAAAQEGRDIAGVKGCAACHGTDGEGGVGPAWVGLMGSEVELADGSTVTADEAYIRTSIEDPTAQVRAGYAIEMPESTLDPTEVEAVISFIRELSS